MRMSRAVVLVSGGLDSAVLLAYVRQRLGVEGVHALSFDYGQKHVRELDAAGKQVAAAGVVSHRIVDLGFFAELIAGGSALTDKSLAVPDLESVPEESRRQPPTYVPNRNMVFLSLAAAHAEAMGCVDVYYGAQAQDEYGYWDCTEGFVAAMNGVLSLNRGRAVAIRAPFARLSKAAVVRLGVELGVRFEDTWSCYRGGARPCGRCPTCMERRRAFEAEGLMDPLDRL
jgi:7-cyano-7-deazaguanine synthase